MITKRIPELRPASTYFAMIALAVAACHAAPMGRSCVRMQLGGDVSAGQEWTAHLGQGWVFRLLPVTALNAQYSGWDLVVDRDPPAGYPDALLLATPPYDSINEREIGTTFGLRAQDAIGWNPRTFRFLTSPAEFRRAQNLFRQLPRSGFSPKSKTSSGSPQPAGSGAAMQALLDLEKKASSGQFRIVDAHIVPGTADPQSFAQAWAAGYARTPHEIESVPPGAESASGRMLWIRFELTLWLPQGWNLPSGLPGTRASCPQ